MRVFIHFHSLSPNIGPTMTPGVARCIAAKCKVDERAFQVLGDQTALGAPDRARRARASHKVCVLC